MLRNSVETLKSRPQLYRAKLGVYLLIASLAIFFVSALIAYAIIRTGVPFDMTPLVIPRTFYAATLVLIGISVTLHLAVSGVRREKRRQLQNCLNWSLGLAVLFLVLQTEGMLKLIQTHLTASSGQGKLYGICFTLALLHAAHVTGGVVFLTYVWVRSLQGRYDHEKHWTVDICATYWHFLDAIWLIMLATFWLTEYTIHG